MESPPFIEYEDDSAVPPATRKTYDVVVGPEPAGNPRSHWVRWKPRYWQKSADDSHRMDGQPVDANLKEWISRHLSWLLRHGARDEGLFQDQYGCVPLVQLMRYNQNRSGPWYRNRVSLLDVYHVIEHSHRFELWGASDQDWPFSVRCLQGHGKRLGLRLDQTYDALWSPCLLYTSPSPRDS